MSEHRSGNADVSDQEDHVSFGRPPWAIVALLGVLTAVVAVGIVWWTFEPQYEATTYMRIRSQQPFLAFAPAESDSAAGDLFVQTQVEMIRSPLVLAPVVGQSEAAKVPELQEEEDPTRWLAKNIVVSSVGKSELFKISLACANPKDSAWILNQVAHEYLLLLGQDEAERTREVINTLQEEKSSRESEVKRLRENLRELSKQITGKDPFSPVQATYFGPPGLDHPLADMNNRLIETEMEQTILAANIKALEKQLAEKQLAADRQAEDSYDTPAEDPHALIIAGLIEEALEQDLEIRLLQRQIRLSQAMLDDREPKATVEKAKEDRGSIELRAAISEDEELLKDRRTVVRKRIEARLAASPTVQFESPMARLEEELDQMRFKLEGLKITKELLQERYESKLGNAKNLSGDTLELNFMQDELAKAEGVFSVLSERILRLTTEQRAPNRVRLLQTASPAKAPLLEVPYREMAWASLVGFCLPFLIVGICCLFGRSRASEDPVFGRIRFERSGVWWGEVPFHGEGVVGVAISTRRFGPTDADRQVSLELRRRYPDLKPSIAGHLFGQYERYQGEVAKTHDEPGVPTLAQPEEIWDHTVLEGFRIEKGSNSSIRSLRLAYTFDWDKHRLFYVHLWDWEVARVEEDRG